MNITPILKEKKENSVALKNNYGLRLKYNPIGYINLSDKVLTNELLEGLKTLSIGFIIELKGSEELKIADNIIIVGNIDKSLISGFDFIICDDDIENLNSYMQKGVTPIIVKNNHMGSLLKEFNPLKNEGNCFFYNELNKWSIFISIVRYLENYKFSFDNKNLVKNVVSS